MMRVSLLLILSIRFTTSDPISYSGISDTGSPNISGDIPQSTMEMTPGDALPKNKISVDSKSIENVLGTGFYMPNIPLIQGNYIGRALFDPDSLSQKNCILNYEDPVDKAQLHLFKTPTDFYTYMGRALQLQVKQNLAYDFYLTLRDISKDIDPDMNIKGAAVELFVQTNCYSISPDCLSNLPFNKDFLKDFDALSDKIETPELLTSWVTYDSFIKKYGSHYYKGLCYGAKIVYYVFTKQALHYTDRQVTCAVCSKFRKANLTFCAPFTDADYVAVGRLEINSFFEVLGGDPDLRSEITKGNPTVQQVYQFLKNASGSDQHINIRVEQIWDLLKRRFLGTNKFQRVLNMLQYHEGLVAHGCFKENLNGVVTRRFMLISDRNNIPEYQCQVAMIGCRSDNDCHLAADSFWTHCYCYGGKCLSDSRHTSPKYGLVIERKSIGYEHGSTYEGENLSCIYHFGPYCYCNKQAVNKWSKTWPTANSDMGHDIAIYRTLYNKDLSSLSRSGASSVAKFSHVFISMIAMKIVI